MSRAMEGEKIKIIIGNNSIKYELNNIYHIEENENIWDDNGLIKDIDMLINSGKNYIKDFKARHCHLEIETLAIIIENIVIPVVNEKKIESLIKFELERKKNINADDFLIKYKVLDTNMVLAYILPKNLAFQIENLASSLKLHIDILDIIVSGEAQNINFFYDKNIKIKKKLNNLFLLIVIVIIIFTCFIIVFIKNKREISMLKDEISKSKTISQKYKDSKDYEKLIYIRGQKEIVNNIIDEEYVFDILTTINEVAHDNNINLLSTKISDEDITILANVAELKHITAFQNDIDNAQEKYLTHIYSIKNNISTSLYYVNISLIKEVDINDIK